MAKTIVEELKDFYVKLGGTRATVADIQTVSEILDAIEQIYHDDTGEAFAVTFERDGEIGAATYTCDKTLAEINAAASDGATVIATCDGSIFAPTLISSTRVEFVTSTVSTQTGAYEVLELAITTGEQIAEYVGSYADGPGLPEVSSADNGRVLTVSNGEWTPLTPLSPPLIVNYTNNGGTYTSPLTFQQILAAHTSERPCFARAQEDLGGGNIMEVQLPLNNILRINGNAAAISYDTSIVSALDGSLLVINLTHAADGTITKTTYTAAASQQ